MRMVESSSGLRSYDLKRALISTDSKKIKILSTKPKCSVLINNLLIFLPPNLEDRFPYPEEEVLLTPLPFSPFFLPLLE